MTFLNPFVLFGLVASAIPIILHLLNLRKLRTIEFSTLQFLKELQKTRIRRLKIKQLLLLILRTLLVLLIVFAFSRPTLTGTFGSGAARARTSVVLLLDDSYSMTASNERGEFFKQGVEAAERVLDLLKDGDEVFFVRLSQVGSNESVPPTLPERNVVALRAMLRELRPVPIHRSLDDGLRECARLLSATTNLIKEVYVISDFQQGAWKKQAPAGRTPENLFPPEARIFLLSVGTEAPQNLGIERVSVVSTILEVEKPLLLTARVRNASERDIKNHLVSVFLEGARVAQKGISLDAGKTVEIEFSIVPKKAGFLQGSVELESDDLEFDNRRYFALYVPERIRVLLCGSTTDLRYVRIALGTRAGEGRSPLVLSQTPLERLTHSLLTSTDVVVLVNPASLTPTHALLLKDFVGAGGGLIVFPGTQMQPTQFNATLANTLQLPRIVGLEQTTRATADQSTTTSDFQTVDLRHPLFQGMFEEQGKTRTTSIPGTPAISTHVRYLPTALSFPLMTLTNGAPFLLEHPVGRGRVLLFAVSATTDWSDFPLQALFVPLLHRSASYLVGEQGKQQEVVAGQPITLNLIRTGASTITIKSPDELVTSIPRSSSASIIRFTGTRSLGIYTVWSGNQLLESFVVNMDPAESLTQPAGRDEVRARLERMGIASSAVTFLTDPSDVQRVVLQTRFGVELWKYFLIAALVVALAELFVARDQKKDFTALAANTA